MQFCTDCGGVLNLFGTDGRELCSACIQLQKQQAAPPAEPAVAPAPANPLAHLADAVLSLEENKIILRAAEGWELWSAPAGSSTRLETMLARAERIYQIRARRNKN